MDYNESTQEVAVKDDVKEEVEDQTSDIGMEYFFEPEVGIDMENEAIDKQVQCEQCKKIFPKRRSLVYHVKMVHEKILVFVMCVARHLQTGGIYKAI